MQWACHTLSGSKNGPGSQSPGCLTKETVTARATEELGCPVFWEHLHLLCSPPTQAATADPSIPAHRSTSCHHELNQPPSPGLAELQCWAWPEHTPTVKECALISVFLCTSRCWTISPQYSVLPTPTGSESQWTWKGMAFAAKCLQWHPVSGVSTTLRSVNYFHPVKPVVQTGGPKRLLLVNNEKGISYR